MFHPKTSFQTLKASFETRHQAAPVPETTPSRSNTSNFGGMPSEKPTKAVTSIVKSIDSVLDTTGARQTIRPMAKLIPSWIGPPRVERPAKSDDEIMKHRVVVKYSSPGLQPPVYIFTSLSDPQWEAVDMQSEETGSGEYTFMKAFEVEEGEYQYKFRLGPGDWWACDETKPTVDDGFGDKNNLLIVECAPSQVPQEYETRPAPLMKHETFMPEEGTETVKTRKAPFSLDEEEDDLVLMKHETFATARDVDEYSLSDYGESDEEAASPLFRHESFAAGPEVQNISPTRATHAHDIHVPFTPMKTSGKTEMPAALEADFQDLCIEKLPTDHEGIINSIRRSATRLMELEDVGEAELGSTISMVLTDSSASMPSLPSVEESKEEELEKIGEADDEDEEEVASTSAQRPVAPGSPPRTPEEPEDDDFEPKTAGSEDTGTLQGPVTVQKAREGRNVVQILIEKMGGQRNALAAAVGILVLAAGILAMRAT